MVIVGIMHSALHPLIPESSRMHARLLPLLTCLVALALCGCGDSGAAPEKVTSSESSFDAGEQAFRSGDFATAEAQLSMAVTAGALQADLLETALLLLARSRIAQGKLAEAEADLKQLESGATAMDQYWLATAELLLKKNDSAGAKRAVTEAKKANPKVDLPASLKGL